MAMSFDQGEKKFLDSIKKDRNVKVLEKFKKHLIERLGLESKTFKHLYDELCKELGANVTMVELYNYTEKI